MKKDDKKIDEIDTRENNNLKIVQSDDDMNILVEIKDIQIDNDLIRKGILCLLRGKIEKLKTDVLTIKEVSKIKDNTGDNTEALSEISKVIVMSNLEALKLRK